MRRASLSTLIAAFAMVCLGVDPAAAINSYNSKPAPERTEVGTFMVLWDREGDDGVVDRFDWYCSGTMLDADTYLTAAHCTDDWPAGSRFFVSLEQDVQTLLDQAAADGMSAADTAEWFLANGFAVEGDPHQDAAFPGPASDPHDIGVVDFGTRDVTPADVWTFVPATLPTAGLLSELGSRTLDSYDWVVAGYGTQEAQREPGGHIHPGGGVRMKAPLDFSALNKSWVRLAMNESRDLGGACYGDSGGPNFVVIGGERILAATTITGEVPCYATNVTYRLDTASARTFLAPYVALP